MVHRSTGSAGAFRAYSGGGGRTLISEVHDDQLMQAMNGQGMKGESFSGSKDGSFKGPESPQNYGFTSVVADAKKGADGQIEQCAEGFMSFMGGNRNFPVCAIMDDRRHRLKNLGKDAAKGAVAMHGQKEWGQQYLNTEDGQFITGNKEKKNRMQLVENKNGQKAQQQGGGGGQGGASARQMRALPGSSRELLAQAIRNAAGKLVIPSKSGVEFEIEEFILPPHVTALAGDGGGAAGGGGGGGGQQGGQGNSKPTGQKTLHKEETDIAIEQNGQETSSQHGKFYSAQKTGSDASMYHENRKKSHQVTDQHIHMRFKDNWYWQDQDGNYFFPPPLVKKDEKCKE